MANHLSAKKSARKNIVVNLRNRSKKTRLKTHIKKVLSAVEAKDKQEATAALLQAQSAIMKAVSAKLIKKNTGSRKVSRLTTKVKQLAQLSLDVFLLNYSKLS